MLGICLLAAIGCGKKDKLGEPVAFCYLHSEDKDNAAIMRSACHSTLPECRESRRSVEAIIVTRECEAHRGSLWCYDDLLGGGAEAVCSKNEDDCLSDHAMMRTFFGNDPEMTAKVMSDCKETASFPRPTPSS